MTIPNLAETASKLAASGLHVFPTVPGGKAPAISGGHKSATDDPKAALKMFRSVSPDCGIAVSLKASGLVAIDWDKYKEDGEDNCWAVTQAHMLSTGRIHVSPQGGYHFIFDDAEIERLPGQAGLTIDIKHDGYVLWPPTNGYTQENDFDFPAIPPKLVEAIEAGSKALKARLGATGTGAMMFATKQEALDALRQNIEGRRHDALMRITLDLAQEHPEASLPELVGIAVKEVSHVAKKIDKARLAEMLDDREGGELWRLFEGALRRVDGLSQETIDAVMKKKSGVLKPITGKAAPAYTTWTSEDELSRKREAARVQQIASGERTRFEPMDDCSTLEPTRWVYGGHYIEGVVSVTAAPGGAGKSLLALTDALSIATGRELLGPRVYNKATVLYWNGEDSLSDLRKRCIAACRRHGISKQDIGGRLILEDASSLPINLVTGKGYSEIEIHDALIDALKNMIEEEGVEVLILDPFVACHSVDENSNSQMEAVMSVLREIAHDCHVSVEVVHHTTKGNAGPADKGRKMTADAVRGASAVINAARAVRVLQPIPVSKAEMWGLPPEEQGDVVEVFAVKSNQSRVSDNKCRFKRVGIELGNGDARHPDGDTIVVAEAYTPPDKPAPYSIDDMVQAVMAIGGQEPEFLRHRTQSPDWAGWELARAMKIDAGEGIARPDMTPSQVTEKLRVTSLLRSFLETGVAHLVEITDQQRRARKSYALTASTDTVRARVEKLYDDINAVFEEEG